MVISRLFGRKSSQFYAKIQSSILDLEIEAKLPLDFLNQCRKGSDPTYTDSEIECWISRSTQNRLDIQIQSRYKSDPTLSDIYFKNKMAPIRTILKIIKFIFFRKVSNSLMFPSWVRSKFGQKGWRIVWKLPVGTYSDGNLFVVYDMSRHVLPTAPSPTTTHLIVCIFTFL